MTARPVAERDTDDVRVERFARIVILGFERLWAKQEAAAAEGISWEQYRAREQAAQEADEAADVMAKVVRRRAKRSAS